MERDANFFLCWVIFFNVALCMNIDIADKVNFHIVRHSSWRLKL